MCSLRFMVVLSSQPISDHYLSGSYTQVTAVCWQSPWMTGVCVLGMAQHSVCNRSTDLVQCLPDVEVKRKKEKKKIPPDSEPTVHNDKEERQQKQSKPQIPNDTKEICKGFAEKIWQPQTSLWRNHLQGAWRQLLRDWITKKTRQSRPRSGTHCIIGAI